MKQHTSDFKNNIKEMGRELKSIITYGNTTLENELYSVSMSYDGNILKSVMKKLEIESSVIIPKDTVLNYQLGLLIDNGYTSNYEYLDYGNFIVYEIEKQEDKNTYLITCYDKMLYSMKDYEAVNVQYPISVRGYINAICTKLGLTFENANDVFANYNRTLSVDVYNGIGYTFRDVLDELAQVTASTICINADDKLEIRYITETNDTINEEFFKDINVDFGEKYRSSKFNSAFKKC